MCWCSCSCFPSSRSAADGVLTHSVCWRLDRVFVSTPKVDAFKTRTNVGGRSKVTMEQRVAVTHRSRGKYKTIWHVRRWRSRYVSLVTRSDIKCCLRSKSILILLGHGTSYMDLLSQFHRNHIPTDNKSTVVRVRVIEMDRQILNSDPWSWIEVWDRHTRVGDRSTEELPVRASENETNSDSDCKWNEP